MAEVRPILNGEEAVEKAPEEVESRRLDVTSITQFHTNTYI